MAKQATALAAPEHKTLVKALEFKGEINALHREALKSGNEMMQNAIRCGELLEEVKGVLKASKTTHFEIWIERNLDFSAQSARSYMRLYQDLGRLGKTKAAFVLKNADSISEARRLITSALPEPEEKKPITTASQPAKVTPPMATPKPSCFARPEDQYPNESVATHDPQDDPQPEITHFKTQEMLHALNLSVDTQGQLWSMKYEMPCQRLNWTAEEAIAFTVGQMLDSKVRDDILQNATE